MINSLCMFVYNQMHGKNSIKDNYSEFKFNDRNR